ncbi:N-acetylmuramoyl-L-alanine amidase [bacterium]|jgi:N-acetylmuramoyl-L-alanine amidase|nr:N-acetylmuramoyl-L-alanine amidase [bacterium]
MSKYTWLFDNGHGGLVNGIYVTPGKRSPIWSDGRQLFEGVTNRLIIKRIMELCDSANIKYINIVPENNDISLETRVKRANAIAKNTPCIYVSVHCNAGGGTGWEVYTTPGETKSDAIATEFFISAKRFLPNFKMRTDYSDQDPDKENLFYVIAKTSCPAILTENLFMDTLNPDCEFLMSSCGIETIAQLHFEAIKNIELK